MDIYDDDDDDLSTKVKHFLSKDSNFRDPAFDPAPYLLKVLKEKEANQQLLVEKQTQLIELENEAQQLIEEISIEKSQEFLKLLDIPQQFGEQLEKLKHNMASVKRKVKETKTLLLMTQKDIQQIHLNCVFNKLIYRRLKEIELKLNQYQTASLALKNHLYLDCAQNLPTFSGTSVLQNALAARSQNLKLRFLSQAIEEIRLFLYFTPRLSLPTTHRFIDRLDDKQQIFNEAIHQNFFKRYQLFKRAKYEVYLSSIWEIQHLEQKTGRVGVIHDIIKGIIRIGKSNQITDSLSLDSKKSINNIFIVLAYFFSKQYQNPQKSASKTQKWFTTPETANHNTFISVLFCVSAALLRKMVIVRRICFEYQLQQVCSKLSSEKILQIIQEEIFELIKCIYFPQQSAVSMSYQLMQHQLMDNLKNVGDFVLWPYFKKIIESCFTILVKQLREVENKLFSQDFPDVQKYLKPFNHFQKKFLERFHQSFMKTMEQIFTEGRGFNLESLDSILASRTYSKTEIQFCSNYTSQDKKTIKQFFNLISILNSLQSYFMSNNFEPQKYKEYVTFILVFFYMKLNSTVFRYIVSPTQYDKVLDVRMKDGKVKNKEKHIQSRYETIITPRAELKPKGDKKHYKHLQTDHPQLRNIEQLKMIKMQTEMFLFYASTNFPNVQEVKASPDVQRFEKELEKHQPSNYDENISSKLLRVWQQLIKPQQQIQNSFNCLMAAVFRKKIELFFNISACIYLQTGAY